MIATHRASFQGQSDQDRLHHCPMGIYILMIAKRNTNQTINGHGKCHAKDKLGDVTENRVGVDISGGLREVLLGLSNLQPEF